MEESALKVLYERRETQEEHLIVQLPVQLRCLHFYTKKLVQVVTKSRNLVLIVQKRILTIFLFPASAGSRWSINCQAVLRDVKGMARRRTLFQKITCSLLKLCSGQIEELKERIGRGRKGC